MANVDPAHRLGSAAATSGPRRLGAALLAPLLLAGAWAAAGEAATLGFDPDRLGESGLYGPPGGLRALDYEYCIPAGEEYRTQVQAIDPSARFMPGSRGRIGCGPRTVLAIGTTHQPGFREVLKRLAALPFVERIEQAHFE